MSIGTNRYPTEQHSAAYYLDLAKRYEMMGLAELERDARRKARIAIRAGRTNYVDGEIALAAE